MSNKATPKSFADLWAQLADGRATSELAVALGCNYWSVWSWQKRGILPERAWDNVMKLAKSRGREDVTLDLLRKLARKSRELARKSRELARKSREDA